MSLNNIFKKLDTSNIKWHSADTLIPENKDLGYRDKTRLTPTRANTNPAASCPASEAHKGAILLPIIQSRSTPALPHTPNFASFHSVCAAFLGTHPVILASLTSQGLHRNLGFIFTASHTEFSELPSRESNPVTHGLVSVAFWDLGKPLLLSQSYIYHAWETSLTHTTFPSSLINLIYSLFPWITVASASVYPLG